MEYLNKTDFYTAPASTKYHESYDGGLVEHSYKVFKQLQAEVHSYQLNYDGVINPESVAIVGLFHDLCKMGFYKKEMRNTKDESGKWIQVPYYTVDDQFPFGHGDKSVILLREFIDLTIDEMLAIRWHMGGFEPKENHSSIGKAYEMCPLAVLLQVADMKATYLKG